MKKKTILTAVLALLIGATIAWATIWSDYGELAVGNIADGDDFLLRDVSDPTLAATGTQKRISWASLKSDVKSGISVDDLVTLSGVAEGAAHLGTFTGTTITDSQTVKAAIQELETAVETKQAGDADLTTYAGITPAANVQSLLGAADYAAMKVLLDLEIGTDIPALSAIVFIQQADCSGITSGGCIDTDNGYAYAWDGDSVEEIGRPGQVEAIADPDTDAIYGWDDSAGAPSLFVPDGKTLEVESGTTTFATTGVKTAIKSTAAAYTVGTTDASECWGGVIYVTGAAVITACDDLAAGMSFSVITIGTIAVSVDPQDDDLIVLDGTALTDGQAATNTSTTGDMIVCTYYDATGWYCASGSPDGDHWTGP